MKEEETFDSWIEKGIRFAGEGNMTDALQAFTEAAQQEPSRFESYTNLGSLSQMEFKHEEAVTYYNEALLLEPTHQASWYGKGLSLAALGRYQDALNAYDKATELDPSFYKVYMAKGYVLMRLGENEQALQFFDSFTQMSTAEDKELLEQVELWTKLISQPEIENNHNNWLIQAEQSIQLGDGESALIWLNKFLAFHPEDYWVLAQRAYLHMQLGKKKEAYIDLKQAIELAPASPYVSYYHACILLIEQDEVKATELLHLATQQEPAIPEPWIKLAELSQDVDTVLSYLSNGIVLEPQFAEPYLIRGKIFRERGRVLDALSDFSKGMDLEPQREEIYVWVNEVLDYLEGEINQHDHDPSAYAMRAQAFMQLGRFEDAISDWQSALDLDAKNILLYRGKAEAFRLAEQHKQAAEVLTQVLKIYPEHADSLFERGRSYAYSHQYAEAIADLSKCLDIEADHVQAHLIKGQTHVLLDERKEALLHLEQAKALGSQDPSLYRQMGLFLIEEEKLEEALTEMEQGISYGKYPDILLDAAYIAKALGHEKKAATYVMESLQLSPNQVDVWELKGELHKDSEQWELALEAFQNAHYLNPYASEYLLAMFELAWQLEKWPEVLMISGKIINAIGKYADLHKARGLAYYHLGKKPSSLKEFESYMALVEGVEPFIEGLVSELRLSIEPKKEKPKKKWNPFGRRPSRK